MRRPRSFRALRIALRRLCSKVELNLLQRFVTLIFRPIVISEKLTPIGTEVLVFRTLTTASAGFQSFQIGFGLATVGELEDMNGDRIRLGVFNRGDSLTP
jgi:hypothetical protein